MASDIRRRASGNVWTLGWLALILVIVVVMLRDLTGDHGAADQSLSVAAVAAARDESIGDRAPAAPAAPASQYEVTIRRPAGPPVIELTQPDPLGRVGRVTCSTCHSVRPPQPENRTPADLKQFHQGLPLTHGDLACYACHNPNDMDTLRRADGTLVEYADVMSLCSQCHGRQAKDYEQRLHGGMTGYWDLTRGGRVRNNCIDCHDPHVPKYPSMQPTFKPRDRFLESAHETESQHGSPQHAESESRGGH